MALVDAILPYLEEEERKKKEAALQSGVTTSAAEDPIATLPPESAPGNVSPYGGPRTDPGLPTGSAAKLPPAPLEVTPPGFRRPNLPPRPIERETAVPLSLAGVRPPPGAEAGSEFPMPESEAPSGAHSMYMERSRVMKHGQDPGAHKGFGNRIKHALQGAGIGALVSIGDAWRNSGGKAQIGDLLGGGIGGAAAGGGFSTWKPQTADELYDRLLLQPEIDREDEKSRIAKKEAIELKRGELGIDALASEIAKNKAELEEMPAVRQRIAEAHEISKGKHKLEQEKWAHEQKEKHAIIDQERGLVIDQRTGDIIREIGPSERKTGTGTAPDFGPGGTARDRYRKQVEDTIRSKENPDLMAIDSVKGDPSGTQRHLATLVGDDATAADIMTAWKGYQKRVEPSEAWKEDKAHKEYVLRVVKQAQDALFKEKRDWHEQQLQQKVEAQLGLIDSVTPRPSGGGGGGGGGGRTRSRTALKQKFGNYDDNIFSK